ncbi:1-deoxy-D-xylulose-5-phosphate synthase [Pleionea sp. CnH1-48]|uniref:1-deoxy-D-xylulose-5-phosphate synthase n=1 Tax=Pleionea sp. CnH1-48 TaxID=2954494 RepID=UPI002097E15B|nr:1-deoxy-D-xylulose-5-phosphate synthase [Pleionea sp. CnH1-48]MCO7226683.1 1-deoxy-D-xylulose-5-phosphate synthase [Pleionea sp. CnH1-48]
MNANIADYPLLKMIDSPADLRALEETQLPLLAEELRRYLINTISRCGGHFAAGLGTVELTIALHYLYNTPEDRIVWDVGHQAYPHKVLTGRRERLETIRQTDGLHPFPVRTESEYDTFAVGHSSTSISAALGMAIGAKQQGIDRKAIAVIGDGAMTAGMAFEAMNHASDTDTDLLVILNDNDMSISENVGGLNNYLAKILSGRFYSSIKEGGKKVLKNMPAISEWAHRAEEHMKGMMLPGTLFEELGFNYIGPIDGHNLEALVQTLSNMKQLKGPQFLHVVTKKGKGYEPAEKDPIAYHGVPIFNPQEDSLPSGGKKKLTYSNIFGQWLCDMAAEDERLVGITPAMREGSDLIEFSRQYPERYYDVGIAEQHCVTLAAGLACEGVKPVVAIYSTFLQRAYDQLIHDCALQDLDVLFAIDRGGLVGGDGATHNGAFDLSYLRCIPNMVIMAAADENECRQMLYTGYQYEGTAAVRYPRGAGTGVTPEQTMTALEIGKGRLIRSGQKIAILSFGSMLETAKEVGETLDATVADMRFIKPIDGALITELAGTHDAIVTLEENAISGGAGSAVNEYILDKGLSVKVKNIGLPDLFVEHGDHADLMKRLGLTSDAITETLRTWTTN